MPLTVGHWVTAGGLRAMSESEKEVWCVWTESGEYEQRSRDLRGVFVSEAVAEAHAAQLRATGEDNIVEVVEADVLDDLPVRVRYVQYAAHIQRDGTEDTDLGYYRGSQFETWSNELLPLDGSRVDAWHSDKYIEVIGSDETLVAAKYAELLAEVREGLMAAPLVAQTAENGPST